MIFSHITDVPGEVASIALPVPYQADALAAYASVSKADSCSLLLESAEIDSKNSVNSLMLIDAALRIECNGQQVIIHALSNNGLALLPFLAKQLQGLGQVTLATDDATELSVLFSRPDSLLDEETRLTQANPFSALRAIQQSLRNQGDEPFAIFLGGVIGYDMVANIEQLPEVAAKANKCPDFLFYLAETALVIDHQRQQSRLVGNVFCGENAAANCFVIGKRLEQLKQLLAHSTPLPAGQSATQTEIAVDISDRDFEAQVEKLKAHIVAGDIFQVVP